MIYRGWRQFQLFAVLWRNSQQRNDCWAEATMYHYLFISWSYKTENLCQFVLFTRLIFWFDLTNINNSDYISFRTLPFQFDRCKMTHQLFKCFITNWKLNKTMYLIPRNIVWSSKNKLQRTIEIQGKPLYFQLNTRNISISSKKVLF